MAGKFQMTIYALIDPRTDEVRYVGATSSPKTRIHSHKNERKTNSKKCKWMDELKALDLSPVMRVLELVDPTECVSKERHWIEFYSDKADLLNMGSAGLGIRSNCTTEKVNVIIRVPDALYQQLKQLAEQNDRTVNAEIVRVLRRHLESELAHPTPQKREG